MNLRRFNSAHNKAVKANLHVDSQCGVMASELQEFFNEEIAVLYQSGDGFVVLHDGHQNTPVYDVITAVRKDKNTYQ